MKNLFSVHLTRICKGLPLQTQNGDWFAYGPNNSIWFKFVNGEWVAASEPDDLRDEYEYEGEAPEFVDPPDMGIKIYRIRRRTINFST